MMTSFSSLLTKGEPQTPRDLSRRGPPTPNPRLPDTACPKRPLLTARSSISAYIPPLLWGYPHLF